MSAPLELTLTSWMEAAISAIYNAKTEAEFDQAFRNFIHDDAKIMVNGKCCTLQQYKAMFQGQKSADVSFRGAVGVPLKQNMLIQTGSVGIFYNAEIVGRWMYMGAPVTSMVTSSMVAMVTEGTHGRKVSTMNEVVMDKPNF